ncbi:MAG: cell division FtsK/SpoIIIE, partial [Solirubrobacterales bacterium]|nr:cell division FtsK/SpoIIIE [Solirubrobacterales bacterium]
MPAAKKKPAPSRKKRPAPRKRATRQPSWKQGLPVLEQHHMDIMGLALVCLGVFLAFPLYLEFDGGQVGAWIVKACRFLMGEIAYAAPVGLVIAGALVVLRPVLPSVKPYRSGGLCLLLGSTLAVAAHTLGFGPGVATVQWKPMLFQFRGGILGDALYYCAHGAFGTLGTHLIVVFLFLAGVLLVTGASIAGVLKATSTAAADTTRALRTRKPASMQPPEPEWDEPVVTRPRSRAKAEPTLPPIDIFANEGEPYPEEPEPEPEPIVAIDPEADPADDAVTDSFEAVERHEAEAHIEWAIPEPERVLKFSSAEGLKPDTRGQDKITAQLLEALSHFGIQAKVVGAVAGPHITRYELRLAPGVKMSKVSGLKDDLAYALAATDIRILAPIPGKQAVGIEVPNANRKMVTLGDCFQARPKDWSPLTVWLGKDVSGKAIGADLAKMPHILVAGTTGAGKSGCINAMLSSVLLQARPDEVRLVLVDPKQVELNHYENVPHLLTPVITSPRKAANALQNLVREMEWRYGIMAMARTRSLPELNSYRVGKDEEPLPYILCVIDELADLMMVAPADVEDSIIRLAQKARAVGIHLVLATQSPRVDVITGMIKANVPSRIAFSVSSQTDSRVILDQNGAESLLGQGDMLFSPVGSSKLQRIQGAYIDEGQIEKLTSFWAKQGEPELRDDLLDAVEPPEADAKSGDDEFDPDEDALLGEAIELVVEMGTASTSMLQRRLR